MVDLEELEQERYKFLPTFFAMILAESGSRHPCINGCDDMKLFWNVNIAELRKIIPSFPKFEISNETIASILKIINFSEVHGFLREFYAHMAEEVPGFTDNVKGALTSKTIGALTAEAKRGELDGMSLAHCLYNNLYNMTISETENGISLSMMDKVYDKAQACSNLLRMCDLAGTIVTIDALNMAARKLATEVIEQDGDYCVACFFTPSMLTKEVIKLVNQTPDKIQSYVIDYILNELGEPEEKTVIAIPATLLPEYVLFGWEYDCQTVFVTLTNKDIEQGIDTQDIDLIYFLSSLHFDTPNIAKIGSEVIGSHWKSRSRLDYVLDISFDKNCLQAKNRNFVRNKNLLKKIASGVVRIAREDNDEEHISERNIRGSIFTKPSVGLKAMLKYFATAKQ